MSSEVPSSRDQPPYFLQGGGATGALLRSMPWSDSPLGEPARWPAPLGTAIALCLNARPVSAVCWGPDFRLFYNDGCAPFLEARHPAALGQPMHSVWPTLWQALAAEAQSVRESGAGVIAESRRLMLDRGEGLLETCWSYSLAPIFDTDGGVEGVLLTAFDARGQVLAEQRRAAEQARHRLMLQQMPGFVALLSGPQHRFDYVNDAYVEIAGPRDYLGRTVREVFPDLAGQGFYELLDRVYREGEAFAGRAMPISLDRDDGQRFIDLLYDPVRDDDGRITGILVGGYDVTEAHCAQQAQRQSTGRQALRLALEDRLRASEDPQTIIATVSQAVGEMLGLGQVAYREVDAQGTHLTTAGGWHDGSARLTAQGELLADHGAAYAQRLREGRALAVADVRSDPLLADATARGGPAADGLAAFIHVPLLRNGQLAAVFAVNSWQPRRWTREEIALVGEIAERVWLAVERLRSEAALRLSEQRYRTLFEAIDVGFCIVEMKYDDADRAIDYRLVEINPAFERQTGLVGAAGKWVSEAAPGLERHWYDLYGKVGLTGEAIRFENLAEPFGRWYDVRAFRTGAPGDHLVAILFNDITERRTAENALRDLNDRLEAEVALRTAERDRMWDTSQDLLLVLDFDGVMRRINPAWTHLLGYEPAELLGHHFIEFVVEEDQPASTAAYVLAKGGSLPAIDNRYRHKDGSIRWISWTAAPADGAIYTTGRDVTAAKERAEELAHAQEALRQSQKMEAVGQLTGGLAHDFNNLLAGISGSLEFIQMRVRQGRVGEIDKYLNAAQGAARRAAALTHRLLAFSRRQTLAPKPTDIEQLVTGMEELIVRTVGPAIAVETINAAGLWPSLIDPSQLENAILNLCINARDAMPHGGKITIETANRWLDSREALERGLEPGEYVSLCVCDTGTGMPPDVIAKAFDPFFTTKPIGLGTGLGLSMIYGFAKQSGGAATIDSEVGQGAMLCIYLPRHLGEAALAGTEDRAGGAPRALQGETVLVVDDEPTVRMLVAEVLEDLGYTPIEAGEGAAGLRVLNSDARVDLLVTDVGLPGGMNGRQLADAARQTRPDLKVLFITGYAENAVLGHGHLDPGMHVLTKPFEMDVLAQRIRELIEGRVR